MAPKGVVAFRCPAFPFLRLVCARGGVPMHIPTSTLYRFRNLVPARSRSAVHVLILCFVIAFPAVSAFAQGSSTGRILGSVTDQTGGTIANAMVTVTDTQRGTARTLTTNDAGEYNAPELTPGTYSVK